MLDIELYLDTRDMLLERNIPEEWVWRAIESPDSTELGTDNNTHYVKSILEHGGRLLRVVVNPNRNPNRVDCIL